MHRQTVRLERSHGSMPELVVAERREEVAAAREVRELGGRDRAAAGCVLPRLERMRDLTARRNALDDRELDPLDVSHDGASHSCASLHVSPP